MSDGTEEMKWEDVPENIKELAKESCWGGVWYTEKGAYHVSPNGTVERRVWLDGWRPKDNE